MSFTHIQRFVQEYADNIAEVLGLDVTILDEQGVRVSGTGTYRDLIGNRAPHGSFFETILQTGKPGMILETKKNESECSRCKFIDQCMELATIGFPIFKKNKVVGVIGIIGFTSKQKEIMIHNANKLINFLSHMSSLLEHKLLLLEVMQPTQDSTCTIHEDHSVQHQNIRFTQIIGQHPMLQRVIRQAQKILNSPSTVLIKGDSGTGKEVLAQAIHHEGKRRNHPFVVVNCAAIPENLLESELFGYEGGMFTGAKREGHRGKFELAHQGTIFLDEIGDLPLSLQPKILRVLQDKKIERLGGRKSIPVDVRVIAATHRNLEQMVKEGLFREDLYYRIHVIPLHLPSLRERGEDIPLLVRHFIHKYSNILNREIVGIDPDLEQWMIHYYWPGNVRQLENVIEYMVNMADSVILGKDDLPEYVLEQSHSVRHTHQTRTPESEPLAQETRVNLEQILAKYEKEVLKRYLQQDIYQKDKAKLAKELQISLATLYRKIDKYHLR